ncbi:spermidine/putrescine ABC transporter, partial [Erysipelothrix sp. strain 2 (EsS2-7-Brazil)]|nr:spermidine/putrescine ABC transporter [Erysipelothrix sp. strain 2 (EsS2-6-Brazil)]MBK2403163.1 spermidine/putrescine ABC transporter [Erysipelothrix sp. strain 2 (EsS2-6-Brazil)]MBK2403204.1 spermidine/putrescine ABC transporter [Erysipelothrix sp. strain 2 (EsS2-6-Brazil)]MBK2404785.1 spermidine/putrescine ABC transporter [Erysipelothrix sp. strain 2 (EsS2-7-Brazil)]
MCNNKIRDKTEVLMMGRPKGGLNNK